VMLHHMTLRLGLAGILLLLLSDLPAKAGEVTICASRLDPGDWANVFRHGPIAVPSHIIFQYAGHLFGTLMDPQDEAHAFPGGGWSVAASEERRRSALAQEDAALSAGGYLAFMTLQATTLTADRPCSSANVVQLLSNQWGWSRKGIAADPNLYFGIYAVYERGGVVTSFSDDSNPFFFAAARGEINASVTSPIGASVVLDDQIEDQGP
jgi:hypothetical protein